MCAVSGDDLAARVAPGVDEDLARRHEEGTEVVDEPGGEQPRHIFGGDWDDTSCDDSDYTISSTSPVCYMGTVKYSAKWILAGCGYVRTQDATIGF